VTGSPGLDTPLLDRVVPRVDGWRQAATGPASATGSYKEWMHFCVGLPTDPPGHLLVNVNVTERVLAGGPERVARLIALAAVPGQDAGVGWVGGVHAFADGDVSGRSGDVRLRLGDNHLDWREGGFELALHTEDLRARLRLRPRTLPTAASRVSFGDTHAIHWVVMPRLEASGWVQPAGQPRLSLDRALAYHDHNWGNFSWGGDLAWEWGFAHPADARCPYSVVFVRVSDGGRHRTLSQAALVWRGDGLVRTFQDRELAFALSGVHRGPRPLTLPGVASLLVPGATSGVPARVEVQAGGQREAGQRDRVRIGFDTTSRARVAIPSDVDPFKLVLLNETSGAAQVSGAVAGETFAFDGPAMMEFVRG